jgi:hypothetical protein
VPTVVVSEADRFWPRVVEAGECWEWTGYKSKKGYGRFHRTGCRVGMPAHKWAYEQMVAEVLPGLTLDHLCFNPSCVNPYHLDQVTREVNSTRRRPFTHYNALKTHCKHGHEFTPENTFTQHGGGRGCIACRNTYVRPSKRESR